MRHPVQCFALSAQQVYVVNGGWGRGRDREDGLGKREINISVSGTSWPAAAAKSERRGTRVKGEPGRQTSIFLGFHPRLQPGPLKANSLISGLHCNPRDRSCLP